MMHNSTLAYMNRQPIWYVTWALGLLPQLGRLLDFLRQLLLDFLGLH